MSMRKKTPQQNEKLCPWGALIVTGDSGEVLAPLASYIGGQKWTINPDIYVTKMRLRTAVTSGTSWMFLDVIREIREETIE